MTNTADPFEIVDEPVLGIPMPVFRHRYRSVREFLLASRRFAGQEYLVDDAHRLTYGQHLDRVASLACVLRDEYSVKPGDRVAIFGRNSVEWVVAFWAAATAGAVVAPINSFWSAPEFEAAAALTDPVVVLGDDISLARVAAAQPGLPRISFETQLWAAASAEGCDPPEVVDDEDDPALLIFTSGTTGRPKAVTHSHRGVIGFVQCNQYNTMLRLSATPPPPGTPAPPPPRFLITAPLFHVSVLHGVVIMQLGSGGAAVISRGRFDPGRIIELIQRERVTMWPALGSAAPRVAAHPDVTKHDMSSLTSISIGGAPVSPAIQESLRLAFPQASPGMRMGYTSSEAVSIVCSIGGKEFEDNPTSTGPIQWGVEVEIRDDTGRAVGEGVDGEIHVRSPYTMLGYWGDPEATSAVLKPGRWLAMGDIGRLDKGLMYINSRARDLVFVSAENVFPTEVEYRIDAHPDIRESAVIGVDHPDTGQALRAYVVPVDGAALDEGELQQWCADGLARYKVPTQWVIRSEPLPRTASGKVVKQQLVEPA